MDCFDLDQKSQNTRPFSKQVSLDINLVGPIIKKVPCDKADTGLNGIESIPFSRS
jgi:hypothetical protein